MTRKREIPTLEQVTDYCLERSSSVDAGEFFDFYETNGWVQGKGKPIKNWHACISTWERRNKKQQQKSTSALEAWSIVRKAAMAYRDYVMYRHGTQPERWKRIEDDLPEAVLAAAEAFGWKSICKGIDDNESVIRGQFLKAWTQ